VTSDLFDKCVVLFVAAYSGRGRRIESGA